MPRDSIFAFGFGSTASLAYSPALGGCASVLRRILMPVGAMRNSVCSALLPRFDSNLLRSRNLSLNLSLHNLFKRPAIIDSRRKCVGLYSNLFGKVNSLVFNPFNLNVASPGLIPLLLLSAGPFAVFRRVVAIVVYSFKRISFRALTHISLKRGIATGPARTNLNAPAPIVFKLLDAGVIAAALHSLPDRIKRRLNGIRHNINSSFKCNGIVYQATLGGYPNSPR